MSGGHTSVNRAPHPITIAQLFDTSGVRRIAIVDDSYDPPNALAHGQQIDQFWGEIEANDEIDNARLIFKSWGCRVDGPGDINDEALDQLMRHRDDPAIQRPHWSALAATLVVSRAVVERLGQYLESGLQREVLRANYTEAEDLDYTSMQLIFLDYYLGPARDDESVENAESIARKIYAVCADTTTKPLIVLMSSEPISEEKRTTFRDKSGLLGGLFYFLNKSDIGDESTLFLRLGTFAKALPIGYDIQKFVETLEATLPTTVERFKNDIRKLGLEDYAYLQRLGLQDAGDPLGDYMLWLYSSYFSYLLLQDPRLRAQQAEIDRLSFDHLPPSHTVPSRQLAELYKSALFDDSVGSLDREVPEQPHLYLGDLFLHESNHAVRMVINAACDLAFTPNGKQKFEPNQTILLIPGKLRALSESAGGKDVVRTELFEYKEQPFRILWDIKNVDAYPYAHVARHLSEQGYHRTSRLRLPFALHVQQAFASNLTRVGMPGSPPLYQAVCIELFEKGQDGTLETLTGVLKGMAFLVASRTEGVQCVLTTDCLCRFKTAIDNRIRGINDEKQSLDSSANDYARKTNDIGRRIDAFGNIKSPDSYDKWLNLLTPFALPMVDSQKQQQVYKDIPNTPVTVCWNRTGNDDVSLKKLLLLDVTAIESPQVEMPAE